MSNVSLSPLGLAIAVAAASDAVSAAVSPAAVTALCDKTMSF